jgi:NADPH2:quinone reductase
MRAILLHEFGPAGNLRYEETADPVPGPGQVRVKVGAAGVHLIDTTLRKGVQMGPLPLPDLPHIPGREVAGIVDGLGAGTDPGWLGKRVVAHLGAASAGYAELAVADAASLHEIPADLSEESAVALIGTGRTAMWVLELAALDPQDVVLVPAAAGGLGTLFVQYAREAGVTVIGAAGGPAKTAQVRALGADLAVDYTAPDWAQRVRDWLGDRTVSVVLDGVGGQVGRTALDLIGPGGRIILFGWSSGRPAEVTSEELQDRRVTTIQALGPAMTQRPGGIRGLEDEAFAAGLRPLVQVFALKDAAAAHAALESRGTVGKVVLIP